MESNFDRLALDLAAAEKARNVGRQREHKPGIMAKALAAHAQGAMTTSAVKALERAIDGGVELPAVLLKALADVPASRDDAEPAKAGTVKAEDIKTPLQYRAEQADTRRRLSLALEGGAISKTQHHRLCKLLDNGKELPIDVARELAKIKLDGEQA